MQRTLIRFILCSLIASAPLQAAKQILLQFSPEADAPVIAKITATDKVILDAAPAEQNAAQGWRQLPLPTPFEGYVPVATLNKSMAIIGGTPVRYLPTADSAEITTAEEGDRYEVIRIKEEWATVRFYKDITGYFLATEEGPLLNLSNNKIERISAPVPAPKLTPIPAPEPVAIPAAPKRINPDEPIAQVDPNSLPPENVDWKPVHEVPMAPPASKPMSPETGLGLNTDNLVVTPSNTQARESTPEQKPAKAPRLLTGMLVREISAKGPYPIRLKSPEGRLIAYVDFSGMFIPDLSPYISQKVYLRGEVHPLKGDSSKLVIYAEDIRLAE